MYVCMHVCFTYARMYFVVNKYEVGVKWRQSALAYE
jgi:hypothetical protein